MIRTRQKNNKITSPKIFFISIVVIVILLVQILFPLFFPYAFSYIFSAIWSGKNSLSSDLVPRSQLVQENQNLRQELAQEQAIASSSQTLLDQNNELKALLNRPNGTKNLILANVLRRPPGAGYDYLILDIGLSDGVSVGNYVYSTGSIPVGQVVEADRNSSKVELYSSPDTNYDVLIGSSHIPATASGQGGGFFSMTVSQESDVSIGDEVIIPAISSSVIGYVSAVISSPTQPFEQALFSQGINPYQTLYMLVETNSASTRPFAGSATTTATSTD